MADDNSDVDDLTRLRRLVDSLGYDLDPSILIGGWATYARVGGDISHDIDLIITDQSLRQRLRDRLDEYSENDIHSGGNKGRGKADGIHVDAYFPFQSRLGTKLRLRVEELAKYTDVEMVSGWLMLTLDAHIATKMAALLDRSNTEKGEKDAREIVRLIASGGEGDKMIEILIASTDGPVEKIPEYVRTMFDLLPRLARLNKAERARYERLRREWVDSAQRQVQLLRAAQNPPGLPSFRTEPPTGGRQDSAPRKGRKRA